MRKSELIAALQKEILRLYSELCRQSDQRCPRRPRSGSTWLRYLQQAG